VSVKALSAAFDDSRAKGSAFTVLLAMADWADHNGRCYPSYGQIATKARVSRATAIQAVNELLGLRELERVERGHAPSGHDEEAPANVRSQWRNEYLITLVRPRTKVVQKTDHLGDPPAAGQVVESSDHHVVQASDHLPTADPSQVVQSASAGSPIGTAQVVQSADSCLCTQPSGRPSGRPSAAAAAAAAAGLAFLNAWNELTTPPLAEVQALTQKRRRFVRRRLVDRPLDEHREAMLRINDSGFCRGEGSRGFVASFDWYIRSPEPAMKALEGLYDDHLSEADRAAVLEWRFRTYGSLTQCPHTPTCRDNEACLRRSAARLRARKFA